jgi:YYY domain-containing protein
VIVVIGEWLAREGIFLAQWWVLTAVAGLTVLPLLWRLLPGLADRGALLMRAAGLLLIGFVFWLLGNFGFLANEPGGVVMAWLIVLGISVAVFLTRRESFDMRAWWRDNRAAFVVGELLFVALLVGWAIIRAHNPDTYTTEKPMDLMFISAIMRSESFPPNDAWMAGYAISYYYFGYTIAAMLGMMSDLSSTITYSMMIVLLVALTAQCAFGVAYNLVRTNVPRVLFAGAVDRFQRTTRSVLPSPLPAIATGLLAAFFVVLMGNFQTPLIEIPYQTRTASEAYLAFWDTPERNVYPEREAARAQGVADTEPVTLQARESNDWGYWWFFRASRVIQDRDFNGAAISIQPIDEFPMFSFLLADSHPHVMVLPFVLFALALAFNVLRSNDAPDRMQIVFYALCLGGLIFFNTWDGPIYMAILVMAEIVRRLRSAADWKLTRADLIDVGIFTVAIVGLAVLFYLPFLIGFRSQAGGFLPNWEFPTLFRQYFIVFGPFVLLLAPFIAVEAWRARGTLNLRLGVLTALGVLGGLIVLMALLTLVGALAGIVPPQAEIGTIITRRLTHIVLTVVLLVGIALVIARLFPRKPADGAPLQAFPVSLSTSFALILIAAGLGLTLVPDYIYLRDNFGLRINTVFKFYYAAWVVFSIAAAYGVYSVISDAQERAPAALRAAMGALVLIVITLGSVYPIFGINYRALQESGRQVAAEMQAPLSLDGGPRFITADPSGSDYASIMCLGNRVIGDDVIAVEAVEGTYNPNVGRVAALTGIPVLFNWPGHQSQWRGPTFPQVVGGKQIDIQTLYTTENWNIASEILTRYGIDYVFFGTTERNMYSPAAETKFRQQLTPVCEAGDSRFYAVRG